MNTIRKDSNFLLFFFSLFVLLWSVFVANNRFTCFDYNVLLLLASFRNSILTPLAHAFSYFGSIYVISAVCIFLLAFKNSRGKGGLLSFTAALSHFLNTILKFIFARPRPSIVGQLSLETSFSYPSGHSMTSMAFYLIMVFLIYQSKSKKSKSHADFLFLLIILIGLSRPYLGAHYPSDVIGGWIFGIIIFLIVLKLAPVEEGTLSPYCDRNTV